MAPYIKFNNDRFDIAGNFFIGRHNWCHLKLDDADASRQHGAILAVNDRYFLVDLKSTNGTFLNGVRINVARLQDGDSISVGAETFSFHDPEHALPQTVQRRAPANGLSTAIRPPQMAARASLSLIERAISEDALKLFAAPEADTLSLMSLGKVRGSAPGERLLILFQVARAINEMTSGEELFERVIALTADVLEADGSVIILSHDESTLEHRYLLSSDSRGDDFLIFTDKLALLTFESNEPILLSDPKADATLENVPKSIKTAMCAPLTHRGKRLGALYIDRTSEMPFNSGDLQMLVAIAEQAALALSNRRLYDDLLKSYEKIEQQQDALIRSEKLAAMGLLSAGVAHDIKNPLCVISGSLEVFLARSGPLNEDLSKFIKKAQSAADRIGSTVNGLLGFGRQKSQHLELFDVKELISQAVELARSTVQGKSGAQLETQIDPDLHPVIGDRHNVVQVLLNLLINAAEALDGGGTVAITAKNDKRQFPQGDDEPQNCIQIIVSDTGPGIPEEIREKVFEPFVTTGKEKGTGLGLWIAHTVIEGMGGTIKLTSQANEGATFQILLPARPLQ